MHRFLIISLLFLMPLQLSWSAIASYSHYESRVAVKHIGHHQSQSHHQTNLNQTDKSVIKSFSLVDTCCTAIISVAQPISSVSTVVQQTFTPYQDILMPSFSARPERPNWVNLA